MKLIEIIGKLDALDQTHKVYAAEPWTEDSECIVTFEPHGGGLPDEARSHGLTYFLDVWTANDFCKAWAASQFHEPTPMQKCARLVQYAMTDD